jgi:hypothetical protein
MLGRVLMKSESAYLTLSEEAENDEQIDVPILLNDYWNKWHPDLWSATIGFIAAIIVGAFVISLHFKINNTDESKLEQFLHRKFEEEPVHPEFEN